MPTRWHCMCMLVPMPAMIMLIIMLMIYQARPFNRPQISKISFFCEQASERAKVSVCVKTSDENNQQHIDVNLRSVN